MFDTYLIQFTLINYFANTCDCINPKQTRAIKADLMVDV